MKRRLKIFFLLARSLMTGWMKFQNRALIKSSGTLNHKLISSERPFRPVATSKSFNISALYLISNTYKTSQRRMSSTRQRLIKCHVCVYTWHLKFIFKARLVPLHKTIGFAGTRGIPVEPLRTHAGRNNVKWSVHVFVWAVLISFGPICVSGFQDQGL